MIRQRQQQLIGKRDSHCEYFQSLEGKLLEESDKLTNFMEKSLISQKSRKQLKLAVSPIKQQSLLTTNYGRMSFKNQTTKNQSPYLKKVKELCGKIKQPQHPEDHLKSESHLPEQERYDNIRNAIYNICNVRSSNQEKHHSTLKVDTVREKIEKSKKSIRLISEAQSLKDTISTESGKSLRMMTEQVVPLLAQDTMKLEYFDLLRSLGQGKVGHVSLVRHKKTNFVCALKEIPQTMLCTDSKMLIQRIRQIKIQSFLDHPNIVQLYSVFVEQGNLYLLMELCCDGNLYDHLRAKGSFSQQQIRSVVKQICFAVQYMHDNDILHRDLKPQNILFHDSIVKICDFGWSVNSPLLRDTYCGTPLYSSPQLVQKQQYDNKIDIWNMGILTYQLLYGRVPFQIRTQEEALKVVQEEIYFPRSKPASPEIKDFILRCLYKNPRERFTIAKLMDHQFLNPSNEIHKLT